jgi:uncharacterized protein YcfJ
MKAILRTALAVAALAAAAQAAGQVTFYEHEGFKGRSFTAEGEIKNFAEYGFNDRASSVVIQRGGWALCEQIRYEGQCVVLGPGRYPSLAAMGLNDRVSSMRGKLKDEPLGRSRGSVSVAQITFYERENFQGRSFTTESEIKNFAEYGFNDRASSAVVDRGGWAICEGIRYEGRCVVLGPGRYPTLAAMGLNNRVSSVRGRRAEEIIVENHNAPPPVATYDYHRRHDERLYDAKVISVRAVVGPPEQRCWVEREQVVQERSGPNVPGAVAGAVIGGILGHQVGGGHGQDLATVGGAAAGAVVGANVGRDGGQQVVTQNVQRCASVPSQARPQYWDVVYNFRGQEHRMQTTAPPGPTVTVNERGEPRV